MSSPGLAKYHHPYFVSATPANFGRIGFEFRRFTGREAEPEIPPGIWRDASLSRDDVDLLRSEWIAARGLWERARFGPQAAAMMNRAAPAWADYSRARQAMDELFAAFRETDLSQWRAQILKLLAAHAAALKAAQDWDRRAEELAELEYSHEIEVGHSQAWSLRGVAEQASISIKGWDIHHYTDYRERSYRSGDYHTPLAAEVEDEVERQKDQLRKVAELASWAEGDQAALRP